ncbi:AraC family transcriptional regulator [Paenibacillus allorhizosphaerae]|uniref:HTH-type transcriptional activator Btr n=1 Tax=Paenibacillus allorhizosphaerae TaxID=2849866 RepID=A0ABM8V9S9_9BACL|nr:AraC family transcriptional regulator [Paenibacillus allorhizosphaerae]CAG7614005.1 HTH-type transcriptional activator Btr [Paenibacillus allorhizosphaerae]
MKEYSYEFRENYRHTPSECEKLGGIWPLRVGQNRAKPNYFVGTRIIDCYSVHFIISGSVFLSHGNEVVHLKPKDIFCLYPNIKYSYNVVDFDSELPLQMCWIAFNGVQASSILKLIGVSEDQPFLRNCLTPDLYEWIKKLFNLVAKKEQNVGLKTQVALYNIFDMLMNNKSGLPSKAYVNEWLMRSIDFINTHFMEGISVMEAVQVAGVHRSHFYNEFNRLLGMSPRQYLIKLRMERASEMLMNTTLSITEISLSTGYPDLYSFSRAFYNFFGVSPTDYRIKASVKLKQIDNQV